MKKSGSKKQGGMPMNLPGKAKKPQSANFGMTAPPMKKGGKVMKKGGSAHCYKKGGSVKGGSVC